MLRRFQTRSRVPRCPIPTVWCTAGGKALGSTALAPVINISRPSGCNYDPATFDIKNLTRVAKDESNLEIASSLYAESARLHFPNAGGFE